jgi:Domain of unknown function (DUF4062)
MALNITLLKVFVASPSDVAEERAIIKKVIDELNFTSVESYNIKLEFIGWETHTYPSLGDDAQDVINKQIKSDYDIFIGVMWKKFGTKTKRSPSGTQEEFEIAYEKFLQNEMSVQILFYFKTAAPLLLDDIDPVQLQMVNDFKKKISDKGALYFNFTQPEEFQTYIRVHLTRAIQKYNQGIENIRTKEIIQENDLDIEELGFYEAFELVQAYFGENTDAITRTAEYLAELTSKIKRATIQLNKLLNVPQQVKDRETRRIADNLAEAYLLYVQRTQIEIPAIRNTFNKGITLYHHTILRFKNEFGLNTVQSQQLKDILAHLKAVIFTSVNSTKSFMNIIGNTPGLTTKFIRARKETVKVLQELSDELASFIKLIEEIEKIL